MTNKKNLMGLEKIESAGRGLCKFEIVVVLEQPFQQDQCRKPRISGEDLICRSSKTLREIRGIEDEDDDEYENDTPGSSSLPGIYFFLRENQRNPVTASNTRFRINGQSVPVFSIDRPKQPQSILKPRTMALSKAPENIVNRIATHTSAPLSQLPTRRQTPTHSSKAGRKTDNTAAAGQGVS
jgi:hypothetical protein